MKRVVSAVGILLAVSQIAVFGGGSGRAQTRKQSDQFEKPLTQSSCVSDAVAPSPAYPFSVEGIKRALEINGTQPGDVHVLVVDNGFLGYRYKTTDAPGPTYLESNNYPKSFFDLFKNEEFLPYFDLEDAPAKPSDATDIMNGHGTFIGGVILGGMYQNGEPKADGSNLLEPDVRRLLLTRNQSGGASGFGRPWLTIRYAPIGYGPGATSVDPLARLIAALNKEGSWNTAIVNMSLARVLTSFPSPYALPKGFAPYMLVVMAAGNATMPLINEVNALPARIGESDQLLIVASHDADGQLSYFSNYGDRVLLAAPGCRIQSWSDGDGAPQALSGTSMSTAIVSFAAALVRSQWEASSGSALRNRLLVSARYSPLLAKCSRVRSKSTDDEGPDECVAHGSMLDIETAVMVSKDVFEYEDCANRIGKRCSTITAVGSISSVPQSLSRCATPRPDPRVMYAGLTRNAAIKRIEDGSFMVAFEPGQLVGKQPLHWTPCPRPDVSTSNPISFTVSGLQPDGSKVQDRRIDIESSRLVRLVTRAVY